MSMQDINFIATLYKGNGRYEVQATDTIVSLLDDFRSTIEERVILSDPLTEASEYILELIQRGFTLANSIEEIYIILDGKI